MLGATKEAKCLACGLNLNAHSAQDRKHCKKNSKHLCTILDPSIDFKGYPINNLCVICGLLWGQHTQELFAFHTMEVKNLAVYRRKEKERYNRRKIILDLKRLRNS